jgi:hypothetical protein
MTRTLLFLLTVITFGSARPVLFAQEQGFELTFETVFAGSGATRTVKVSVHPQFVRLDIDDDALQLTLAYDRSARTVTDWDRRRDRRRVISAEDLTAFREKGRRYADQLRESAEKPQNGTPEQTLCALQRRNPASPIFWRTEKSAADAGLVKLNDRNCTVVTAAENGSTSVQFWSTPAQELGLGSAEATVLAEMQDILFDAGVAFNGFRLSDGFFEKKGSDLLVAKSIFWLDGRTETTTVLRTVERRTFSPDWLRAEK